MIKYHPKTDHDVVAVEIKHEGSHLILCRECARIDPKLNLHATFTRIGGTGFSIEYLDSRQMLYGETCQMCLQEIELCK